VDRRNHRGSRYFQKKKKSMLEKRIYEISGIQRSGIQRNNTRLEPGRGNHEDNSGGSRAFFGGEKAL